MMRFILVVLIAVFLASPVSAEVGNRAHERADATCARLARKYARNGLTERERAILTDRIECREIDGVWVSSRVWSQ